MIRRGGGEEGARGWREGVRGEGRTIGCIGDTKRGKKAKSKVKKGGYIKLGVDDDEEEKGGCGGGGSWGVLRCAKVHVHACTYMQNNILVQHPPPPPARDP